MENEQYRLTCGRCRKTKAFVEIARFGVSHDAAVVFVCQDCCAKGRFDKEWIAKNPETARRIASWAKK